MKRKIAFLFSVIFICNFGYQIIQYFGDPYFNSMIIVNNLFLTISMLFFAYIIFFIKNNEVEKTLRGYYLSFNIKRMPQNKYSFNSMFCWLFFTYFHYHLLTFAGSTIFPILYSPTIIMERLTIDLIYNIEFVYGWVVRLVLLYPLPFMIKNIVSNKY